MTSHEITEVSYSSDTQSIKRYFGHLKWEHLVAGTASGGITAAILHPLELAKIRLQVNEGFGIVKIR